MILWVKRYKNIRFNIIWYAIHQNAKHSTISHWIGNDFLCIFIYCCFNLHWHWDVFVKKKPIAKHINLILYTKMLTFFRKKTNVNPKNKISHSQLGQDLEVLKVYNEKQNGFFVEIGASDGVEMSNTYLLETKYNWKGICCEPIPNRFKKLVANRPNSKCFHQAVYNQSGLTLTFDIANNYDLLSGISEHIDSHKSTVDANKHSFQVETISLLDVLDRANAPSFIEYMSLDTEGSELEILKQFDFGKYTFGLIDVEHNFVEPRRTQIKNLLLSNGYIYKGENNWDDMYKHSSI